MCADKRINSKFNVRHGHHVGGVKTPTYAVWVGIPMG
jgi:hypothetical protein